MAFAHTRARINEYAKDKMWYWHVPLWLFGAFLFVQLLSFDLGKPMPFVLQIPHAFDFMLHEFAHVFTAWLPPMMTAVAGSASELLLGALLVYGAFQFRNYFASLFCCLWLMLACMSVGSYMADAVKQEIPLVSLGGALAGSEQTIHDWNFIFGELGLLESAGLIGESLKIFGILVGVFGLLFSAWIMYKMAAAKDEKAAMTPDDLARLKAEARGGSKSPVSGASQPPDHNSIYPAATKGALADSGPVDPGAEHKDLVQK